MTATIADLQLSKVRRMYLVDTHSDLIDKVATEKCSDAFKELFTCYSKKIYSYGMANGLSEPHAQEIVQEVMTRVWTRASLYNSDKGSVSAWIFTIARNVKFDLLRKTVKDKNIISSDEIWNTEGTTDFIDQDADQDQILKNKELRNYVEQLPDQQKEVITDVYFNGLTQEEYSSKNNLPLGTVKSRIRLAIRKLNILLEAK